MLPNLHFAEKMPEPPHLLLTSLGTNPRETTYELNGSQATASFAPLALWRLLPEAQRPRRVVVLVTPTAARDALPRFTEGAEALGLGIERCDIPAGSTSEDLSAFLHCAAARVPRGSRLTLDVTHGLRHHAFLFYSLALYLSSLRDVQIEGAWYGLLESGSGEEAKPIVDLRPVLALAEWFYAVRIFKDHGAAAPISKLTRPFASSVDAQAERAGNDPSLYKAASAINRVAQNLEAVSFAYESALPLELGRAAEALDRRLAGALPAALSGGVPLADELKERIREAAAPLAFSARPANRGKWKESIPLDDAELDRQRRLIEQYLERDQLPLALGLMREWVVSWVARAHLGGAGWLTPEVRKRAEKRLGALGDLVRRRKTERLSEDQQWWGQFWNKLADLRNAFAHQGMRSDEVKRPTNDLASVWESLQRVDSLPPPVLGGGSGRLVISPQGTSPGVLFNALISHGLSVDRCLVVCSEESRPTLQEAAAHAGFNGELVPLVMADPKSGAAELKELIAQAEDHLLGAETIVANLTGGTTLMGVVVQALVEKAARLDRPSRRFLLIDGRTPAEQRQNPYMKCDIHWLDSPQESANEND